MFLILSFLFYIHHHSSLLLGAELTFLDYQSNAAPNKKEKCGFHFQKIISSS